MTIAFEAPALATTAAVSATQTDTDFAVTYLGLMGYVTSPLHQVDDARLVTVAGTVVDAAWDEDRTIWLQLRTDDGATGLVGLDMAVALPLPAQLYAVGRRVAIRGVARTHYRFAASYVAVRTLAAG